MQRKHREHVPAKLTESEFWTKFFQSHYFHRDRINTGTKDLFTECAKIDDLALRTAVATGAGDVLFDIQRFGDNSLQEGFGGAQSNRNGVNSGNIVHQSLIKRFNQHSTMVLNTCTAAASASAAAAANGSAAATDANAASRPQSNAIEPPTKQARIEQKIFYDDLAADEPVAAATGGQLALDKVERYLIGPVASGGQAAGATLRDQQSRPPVKLLDESSAAHGILCESNGWHERTPHKVLVSATAAVNALGELSPGGALMRGFQEQSLARELRWECSVFFVLMHKWTKVATGIDVAPKYRASASCQGHLNCVH